jgi:hypothetical protein
MMEVVLLPENLFNLATVLVEYCARELVKYKDKG